MKPITRLLPLLSFLMIGCATTYDKPQLTPPNNWSVTTATSGDESNLPYLAWWQGFNDPLLNRLVESAIANNNSLNMSRSHIEAAEGELKKSSFNGFQMSMSFWVIRIIPPPVSPAYSQYWHPIIRSTFLAN